MDHQFEQFNNKKILDELCPRHNTNFWQISVPIRGSEQRRIQEFCPECTKEGIKQKEVETLRKSKIKQISFKTYEVFERDSIIPERMERATFNNFMAKTEEEKDLLLFMTNQATKYLSGMVGNTLLTGPPGIGKTHLSISLAKAINEGYNAKGKPKGVLFVTFTEIINKIKDGWNYGKESNFTDFDAVELLTKPDYLILDDLGAKNAVIKPKSDWEQDLLFNILNNRENTIINTNLTSEELKNVYNSRNYSRILAGLKGNTFKATNISDKRYEGL